MRLDDALSHHGIGNLLESSDISADHVIALEAVCGSGIIAGMVNAAHDALELGVDLVERPRNEIGRAHV